MVCKFKIKICFKSRHAGAGLCGLQLLCRQPVTRGDTQRQTLRLKRARERLAVALRADRLAREAEI